MGNYSLYIHTNKINKKVYIGITCQQPVSNRWKNGAGYKKCPLFYNAIKKYGWENFEHQIVLENLTKTMAEQMEKYFIYIFKANQKEFGYNIENGGKVSKMSEEQKEHLRIINTGKHHTEETKKKMSISHKGTNYRKGTKQSEHFKQNKRNAWLGINNPRSKKVNQFSLDGKYIKEYSCMEDIKRELNIATTCHISDCCRGVRHKAYGFIWKYSE